MATSVLSQFIEGSITRDEALGALWDKRSWFEEKDKLSEFEELEKAIKTVPVVNLTVAVSLSSEEVAEVLERIKKMFKKEIFLELRIDPNIVGGLIIVWKGMVLDYSVRKVILEKKREVSEMIAKELRKNE